MYRATLREGKTYHVGGVTFTKGTPRVVSDELGEYLKTVAAFEVVEFWRTLPAEILMSETLHAADLLQALSAKEKQQAVSGGSAPTGETVGVAEDRKRRRTAKRGKQHA